MSRQELAEVAARAVHKMSVALYEQAGYDHFVPAVMAMPPGGKKELVIAPIEEMVAGRAYQIVQRMIMSLPFVPIAVVLTADTFMVSAKDLSEEEKDKYVTHRKTGLAEMFQQGDPNVSEVLATTFISADTNIVVSQKYKWSLYDGFEWEEPIIAEDSLWDFERLISGKPKLGMNGYPICPICGHLVPNDSQPGEYPGAMSRVDNRTEICSDCGTREAMLDFFKVLGKEE
jgi:hypothetical protein